MTERIYKEFHVHGARQLVESVSEAANDMYYVFTSKHTSFTESSTPTPSLSISNSVFQTYDEMLFGKQITSSDISHGIENVTWANNTIYYPYDDQDANLYTKNYYVVIRCKFIIRSLWNCIHESPLISISCTLNIQ